MDPRSPRDWRDQAVLVRTAQLMPTVFVEQIALGMRRDEYALLDRTLRSPFRGDGHAHGRRASPRVVPSGPRLNADKRAQGPFLTGC